MKNSSGPTAILLFSLSAEEEAQRKPLAGTSRHNRRVWQAMEQLTLQKVQAAGLPGFVSYRLPIKQSGTFSEQLRQAALAVLQQGYQSVICIGNDCPSLRPADLLRAAYALDQGQLPLGTDRRGGVYLTGFTRQSLTDKAAFELLPWQTGRLASALATYLRGQGETPVELPAQRADWNTRTDARVCDLVGPDCWTAVLIAALWPGRTVFSARTTVHLAAPPAQFGLRGPPVRV